MNKHYIVQCHNNFKGQFNLILMNIISKFLRKKFDTELVVERLGSHEIIVRRYNAKTREEVLPPVRVGVVTQGTYDNPAAYRDLSKKY